MEPIAMALLGVGAVLVAGRQLARPSVARLTARAAKTGDVAPVIAALAELPYEKRATALHGTMRSLWDVYQREQALEVLHAVGPGVEDAKITQYWIRQALEIEPELTEARLDADFLERTYRPEVAAGCGSGGCGSC